MQGYHAGTFNCTVTDNIDWREGLFFLPGFAPYSFIGRGISVIHTNGLF